MSTQSHKGPYHVDKFYKDFNDGGMAKTIVQSKYMSPTDDNDLYKMWERIAEAVASVEPDEVKQKAAKQLFMGILRDYKFVPGGRIMHGAGRDEARRKPTLSNCYVIGIRSKIKEDLHPVTAEFVRFVADLLWEPKEVITYLRNKYDAAMSAEIDKLESIVDNFEAINELIESSCYYPSDSVEAAMDWLKEAALVYRTGGGIGCDVGVYRPKGSEVNATVKNAPGATWSMHLFSELTNTISQSGRRGALMITIPVWHPDVEDFITIKNDPQRIQVRYANISVKITDEFMKAVEEDKPFNLRWRGKVFKTVNARDLWHKIIANAHASAEPGIIFWDTMRKYHNLEQLGIPILSTNPCFPGDVRMATSEGLLTMKELAERKSAVMAVSGKQGIYFQKGVEPHAATPVVMTRAKAKVYRIITEPGYEVRATADHVFFTVTGEKTVADLKVGDQLYIQSDVGMFGPNNLPDAYELGKNHSADSLLPDAIWSANYASTVNFLKGLFDTYGKVRTRKNVSFCTIDYLIENKALLKQLQILLTNFGIYSEIRLYNRKLRLSFTGESRERFMRLIGTNDAEKRKTYEVWQERTLPQPEKSPYLVAKVVEVVEDGEEPVYDCTVSETHSLIVNGIEAHNCGEQPLADRTACNLGAINLSAFVDENGHFDYDQLQYVATLAVRFMDNVIEYNRKNHATEEISEAVDKDRRVGLGIMGLADMLIKMGIRYDSTDALGTVDQVIRTYRDAVYRASIALAQERGSFEAFNYEGYSKSYYFKTLPKDIQDLIKKHGIRNGTLLTVAPTGTTAIVAGTSSGIEPIFQTSYLRRVKQEDGLSYKEYKVYHPLIAQMFGGDEDLPDYVVTAHTIDPKYRVQMQGVIQRYIDSSISSTINLPEETDVDTIAEIYELAHAAGLKGVTVYREGSREGILITEKKASEAASKEVEPVVQGSVSHPVQRPSRLYGYTEKIRTGRGNMLVTLNQDSEGRLFEVIARLGKSGGDDAATCEALSRIISIALRSGVDPMEIVDQLIDQSGDMPVVYTFSGEDKGTFIKSTPDAIGQAIARWLLNQNTVKVDKPAAPSMPAKAGSKCPTCGSATGLIKENGCERCIDCNYSKCG